MHRSNYQLYSITSSARGDRRGWNGEAERSCGLEVNHQLEPCRLFHRQLTRSGAVQNLRDLLSGRGSHLAEAGPYDMRPPASTNSRNANIVGKRFVTANSAICFRSATRIGSG
jgi:hypothetical protein